MICTQSLVCNERVMEDTSIHLPVMADKVVEYLVCDTKGVYVDATLGCGGHSLAILRNSNASVIGFDLDKEQIEIASKRLCEFGGRISFINANYKQMNKILDKKVDGVLFDFGFSSYQLDNPRRGFSYRKDGPLDMRFGRSGATAGDIIKNRSEEEIADILFYYGGERASRRIAKKIKAEKPETTGELALLVRKSVPRAKAHKHLGRVFQAFRIAVNEEFRSIENGVLAASGVLKEKGRIVTITYHKDEEKIVCKIAKEEGLKSLLKKPVKPEKKEFERNPRCRSAHLRVFEK
jgi:16S rRNA (cytosine1402-N4)-methyltransferase